MSPWRAERPAPNETGAGTPSGCPLPLLALACAVAVLFTVPASAQRPADRHDPVFAAPAPDRYPVPFPRLGVRDLPDDAVIYPRWRPVNPAPPQFDLVFPEDRPMPDPRAFPRR